MSLFPDSMVGEMVVEAGKNVTLNCPGVTENSLILMLEWRVNSMQLLEYSSNTTIVWNHQNRVSLSLKNYALQFHPVTAQDTGEYTCLVNSRSMPEAVISLIVHGECSFFFSVSLRFTSVYSISLWFGFVRHRNRFTKIVKRRLKYRQVWK